jgi:hypothetical protein
LVSAPPKVADARGRTFHGVKHSFRVGHLFGVITSSYPSKVQRVLNARRAQSAQFTVPRWARKERSKHDLVLKTTVEIEPSSQGSQIHRRQKNPRLSIELRRKTEESNDNRWEDKHT